MERKSRRNRKEFIIIELILLIITVGSFITYSYYTKKESDNNYKQIISENDNNYKKLQELETNLEDLEKDISNIKNIDEKINSTKENYYKLLKELENKIISGDSNKKIAYLTFDDGPYYNTYKVLDILDKYNVKATFFTTSINGTNCYDKKDENCKSLYQEYLKRGHTIANHTYTHAIHKGLYKSVDSFVDALKMQENEINKQTGGYVTNILRFPGGSNSARTLKEPIKAKLKELGYGWVDWTANDGDGGKLSSKEEAWNNFTSSIDENIEVVLLHDYSRITTSILPEIIEYLQEKGYILLPLFYESNMINK